MVDPVRVVEIEVVQAIQEPAHGVTLVAGKATVARVYLETDAGAPFQLRGTLRAARSGGETQVAAVGPVRLDASGNGDLRSKRRTISGSLNFRLPAGTIAAGELTLELASVEAVDPSLQIELQGTFQRTVTLVQGPRLRLQLLGIRYRTAGSPRRFLPSQVDRDRIHSWLRRAYPVPDVEMQYRTVDARNTWPFSASQVNAQLAAIRRQDLQAGTDRRTHYYGLVDDGNGAQFMRGRASGIPTAADPSVVASGPTGANLVAWDRDGSYGDWYTGHELGHTFGRRHPGFCQNQGVDDSAYPYANGQLADAASAEFVGLDVGDSAAGIAMAALPGDTWHDVMTYCPNQWLSNYTYEGIRRRLLAEDGLGAGATAGLAPTLVGGASPQRHVNVIALVNLSAGTGSFEFVQPLQPSGEETHTSDDLAVVRVLGGGGKVLAEHGLSLRREACVEGEDEMASLDAVIPLADGAAALELVHRGVVLDAFRPAGPSSPLAGLRPIRHDAAVAGAEWDSPEAADPLVTYTVQVSRDGGNSWETIGVCLPDPRVELDPAEFPGLSRVRMRILATNGFEPGVPFEDEVPLS